MPKGYPLPVDINPPDDCCVRVWIPNSAGYRRALMGSVALLGKWWAWERDTEKRGKDAAARYQKAYAKTIGDILAGLSCDCSGAPPASESDIVGADYGDVALWGGIEEIMAGVLDIKIENGILYKRMHPCCEWFAVGTLAELVGQEDVYDVDGVDPPATFNACGRADAVVEFIREVGDTMWQQRDNFPWHWCSNVHRQHPELDGGCASVAAGVTLALEITALGLGWGINVNAETDWLDIRCRLEASFEATGDVLSDSEWDAVRDAISGVYGINVFYINYWMHVVNAIGRGDLSKIAQLGARVLDANCECSEAGNDPAADLPEYMTWAYSVNLANGLPDWLELAGESEYVAGVGVVDYPSATGIMDVGVTLTERTWLATTDIEAVIQRWKNVGSNDYQGVAAKMSTPSTSFYSGTGDDSDPSAGGTFTKMQLVDYSPVMAGDSLTWQVENRSTHGDDTDYTTVLQWIVIAGTGDDPNLDA